MKRPRKPRPIKMSDTSDSKALVLLGSGYAVTVMAEGWIWSPRKVRRLAKWLEKAADYTEWREKNERAR